MDQIREATSDKIAAIMLEPIQGEGGVNVPDELRRRIEPIRRATNVSQICWQAIKDWADAYERATDRARGDGMDEAATRLQAERERQSVDWEALGHEDAKL